MIDKTRIFQFSETSILIEFDDNIDEKLLNFLTSLRKELIQTNNEQILQVNNTYNSLLITYVSTINNFYREKERILKQISEHKAGDELNSTIKKIPICYDTEFGWDLELLSDDLKLSVSEIIERHSGVIYTVYFIGFLPGFPYLGGLDSSLFHRRKSQPRRQIPMGSVGIADKQTGIYPMDSPGGWQIIGRSPLQLFDPGHNDQPCYLKAGDKIQFESITIKEFKRIQSSPKSNSW